MGNLSGRDFPEVHPHIMQECSTRWVKRRRKKPDVVFLATCYQLRVHFKGKHQLGAHLQLAFCSGSVPRICLLILCLFCKNRNVVLRNPGLELDIISTRSSCCLYHFLGNSNVPVIIYSCFRNNSNPFRHPCALLARRNSTSARSSSLSTSTLFFLSIKRA